MTDHELAEMSIEDRNRILDAFHEEIASDLKLSTLPIFGWAWSEDRAEFDREYSLLDDGPLPGYDAFDMEYDR